MSRYAEGTKVAPEKTRMEIEALLAKFGAVAYQWTVTKTSSTVRFQWAHNGTTYTARLGISVPDRDATWKRMIAGSRRRPSAEQLDAEVAAEYRRIHRLLLLKLKGDLYAVTEGLVSAVEVLLPYLETPDGQTVAEALVPRLVEITTRGPVRMLEDHRR